MSKSFALMLILVSVVSCRQQELCNGDLVFVSGGQGEADQAITGATGSFSHVGIIEVQGDSVFVIDASFAGVRRRPLDSFIQAQKDDDGVLPELVWKRVVDNSLSDKWVRNAKSLIGSEYDFTYLPENGMYYCSELVYETFLDKDGDHVFEAAPMNFKNAEGTFDAFWVGLFDSLGVGIPQGVPGTNPSDMCASANLCTIEYHPN